jgi:hypothetical protein
VINCSRVSRAPQRRSRDRRLPFVSAPRPGC